MITLTRRSTRDRYGRHRYADWKGQRQAKTAELEGYALTHFQEVSPEAPEMYGFLLPSGRLVHAGYGGQHADFAARIGSHLDVLEEAGFDPIVMGRYHGSGHPQAMQGARWVSIEVRTPLTRAQQATIRELFDSGEQSTVTLEGVGKPRSTILSSGVARDPVALRRLMAATNAVLA